MEERSPRILRSNSCRASVEDAVTWWTYLVRVMCVEVTNDSALPVVVIPAWAIASVHPLPNSHDPIALRTANSMRSPPSITTSLSSPMVSGYLHCISSAKPYMGWSNAITAACPWSEVFNSFHRNRYAMLDHGYRVRSFCKKRQQPTLASCVFAFLSFSVVSRPWYYCCCVLVRGFSISSLLGNRGLRILFVSLPFSVCVCMLVVFYILPHMVEPFSLFHCGQR